VDDGEVMRAFRNNAIAAAWLTMDEVLEVMQSGAVDPVILFISDESRGGDAIVAQPDLITTTDLKDRRIAAQINSVNAYLLDRALRHAGLEVSDVHLVNLPPYRQLAAFKRREVDAVVTYEPVRSQVLESGGVEIFSSLSTPFEVLRVFVIRRDYLESHQDDAAAICTAWDRAVTEMASSAEARSWIANRLGTSPVGLERILDRMRIITLPESRDRASVSTCRDRFPLPLAATCTRLFVSPVSHAAVTSVPASALPHTLLWRGRSCALRSGEQGAGIGVRA
jgi:NitT/TauT family transport system substrate-binding protein